MYLIPYSNRMENMENNNKKKINKKNNITIRICRDKPSNKEKIK